MKPIKWKVVRMNYKKLLSVGMLFATALNHISAAEGGAEVPEAAAAPQAEEKTVKVQTNDRVIFNVPLSKARTMRVISGLLDDLGEEEGDDNPIFLQEVDGQTFDILIDWIKLVGDSRFYQEKSEEWKEKFLGISELQCILDKKYKDNLEKIKFIALFGSAVDSLDVTLSGRNASSSQQILKRIALLLIYRLKKNEKEIMSKNIKFSKIKGLFLEEIQKLLLKDDSLAWINLHRGVAAGCLEVFLNDIIVFHLNEGYSIIGDRCIDGPCIMKMVGEELEQVERRRVLGSKFSSGRLILIPCKEGGAEVWMEAPDGKFLLYQELVSKERLVSLVGSGEEKFLMIPERNVVLRGFSSGRNSSFELLKRSGERASFERGSRFSICGNGGIACQSVYINEVVIFGFNDGTVELHDLDHQDHLKMRNKLLGHKGAVTCLAVFPDGSIVTGSKDKTVRVWSVDAKGKHFESCVLIQHEAEVASVGTGPDGLIVSGDRNGEVCIWEKMKENEWRCSKKTSLPSGGAVISLKLLSDGTIIVLSSKGVLYKFVDTNRLIKTVFSGEEAADDWIAAAEQRGQGEG